MLDPRFEEDTLFLVFEEDFRFEDPNASLSLPPASASSSEPAAGERMEAARDRVQLTRANKDPSCV
jgi:hypothetical protein